MTEKRGTFEESFSKLTEITRALERGEMGLEESLEKYKEGVELIKICQKSLDRACEEIKVLTQTKETVQEVENNGTQSLFE